MAATLRILHLSDLHARGVDGPQAERARREAARRKRVLGERWRDNLAELGADGRRFDLVVFTGDLADWGHGTDYAPGVAFLRDTCARLGVPLDRLFVVPGNHDVDRTIEPEVWAELRAIAATEPRRFSPAPTTTFATARPSRSPTARAPVSRRRWPPTSSPRCAPCSTTRSPSRCATSSPAHCAPCADPGRLSTAFRGVRQFTLYMVNAGH